jgi:hypothetical protein
MDYLYYIVSDDILSLLTNMVNYLEMGQKRKWRVGASRFLRKTMLS